MNAAEEEQYRRHISLEGFGREKQLLLKKSSVLVVGAGGLGCSALQYLASAGVGKIGIIDDDSVEISNLQRQVLYSHEDQGKPKAVVACEKLSKMNPFVQIFPFKERFTKNNAKTLLKEFEVVVDGTDNFSSRYLLNDACVMFNRALVHGSIHKFEGMVSVFNYKQGPTYRCLFPEQPEPTSVPSCAEAGVLGVLPGIIGCWQALEAIKIITGIGDPLSKKVLLYNALTQSFRTVSLNTIPENREIKKLPDLVDICSLKNSSDTDRVKEINESEFNEMMLRDNNLQILDVREDWERSKISIQPSLHLPLGNLTQDSDEFIFQNLNHQKEVVVYCKAGIRSRMACQYLQQLGFTGLYNLSNGMDGWMMKFPRKTVKG